MTTESTEINRAANERSAALSQRYQGRYAELPAISLTGSQFSGNRFETHESFAEMRCLSKLVKTYLRVV